MTSTTHVNFICLKWGNKYGPEYVNRLYCAVKRLYSRDHTFYCFTDSSVDLDSGIVVRDLAELREVQSRCFTIEKVFLFGKLPGNNVFLDLDIVLLRSLDSYLQEYGFSEGRFIKNHWMDEDYVEMNSDRGTNYVNSSVISWRDDQLDWVREFYLANRDVIEFKYRDLDTFLFQALRKKLKYHPHDLAYSFNAVADRRDYAVVMFNTSQGRGVELHDAPDWIQRAWVGNESILPGL